MPTFGRDSIRKFSNNVSELKKLGARDYENLLQVAYSIFIFIYVANNCISVLYQFWMVFYHSRSTIMNLWMFCFPLLTGMH